MSNYTASIIEFPNSKFSSPQDFLESDSKEYISTQLENPPSKKIQSSQSPIVTDELLADLDNLTKMELRAKYKREESSHRNRKNECKKKGGNFAEEFEDFRSFLRHVGVCPGPGKWSLDRIDNTNLDYGPGLVRWADDKTQNNNKADTVLLSYRGITRPLTAWAEETGQKPDTLRKRRNRGWSDRQVIYGKPPATTKTFGEAPSIWKRLVPDREPESYEKMETAYLKTRQSHSSTSSTAESRPVWLAAVSRKHMTDLMETLTDQEYEGVVDRDLEIQYFCWEEILDNIIRELDASIGRSILQDPRIHRPRAVGRITWRIHDCN